MALRTILSCGVVCWGDFGPVWGLQPLFEGLWPFKTSQKLSRHKNFSHGSVDTLISPIGPQLLELLLIYLFQFVTKIKCFRDSTTPKSLQTPSFIYHWKAFTICEKNYFS